MKQSYFPPLCEVTELAPCGAMLVPASLQPMNPQDDDWD